jgi:hypothetical protein
MDRSGPAVDGDLRSHLAADQDHGGLDAQDAGFQLNVFPGGGRMDPQDHEQAAQQRVEDRATASRKTGRLIAVDESEWDGHV